MYKRLELPSKTTSIPFNFVNCTQLIHLAMHTLTLVPLLFGVQSLAQGLISRNFPHLIVPINKATPDTAKGTQKEFDIERDVRPSPPYFH
jgi:hypothetical protein